MQAFQIATEIENWKFSDHEIALITFIALAKCAENGRGAWQDLRTGISDDGDKDEIMSNLDELVANIVTD